ncbi:MAG: phosphoribosyltransferase family protein [Chlamydiales bacterium]|nr:phosphoribosyltransferase family protein [Chlamydiales bacterium]
MLRKIFDSWLNFTLPSFCIHCDCATESGALFCEVCLQLLHLLSPQDRCAKCFQEGTSSICIDCKKIPPLWHRAAAAFDYIGPAGTLVKRLKYGGLPHLAKGAAAFLVAQIIRLEWPLPDVVVPVPMPHMRQFIRGYNQSLLIADEVARMLDRPMHNVLKRHSGSFAQAGLNLKQRQLLSQSQFVLKAKRHIEDRTVLLIDDVFTTGATIRCCAAALLEGYPKDVYALTVCRATL